MKLLIALLCVSISACAPQQIVRVPVEVPIQVSVKCKVKYPEKPVVLDADKAPTNFYEQGVYLMRENTDYKTYSWKLEAALKSCAEPE